MGGARAGEEAAAARGVTFTFDTGMLILQGTFFSVPVMVAQTLHELSHAGVKSLGTTICSSSGRSLLAPRPAPIGSRCGDAELETSG
jgi:hypothetical protein